MFARSVLSRLGAFCVAAIALMCALPIFVTAFSILAPADAAWVHLRETVLTQYIWNTLILLAIVGVGTSVIGVATAWLIASTEFPGRAIFGWLLVLPLASPAYILGYAYADFLDVAGPVQSTLRAWTGLAPNALWVPNIRSLPGAGFVLSIALYPYVYLITRAAFAARSGLLLSAARSLNAGPWTAFLRVALPAARPAIAGGLALVLMETLAEFGVAEHFGVPTFSIGIFRTWYGLGERDAAMKLAALALIVVFVLLIVERASRKGELGSAIGHAIAAPRAVLRPWQAAVAILACGLPVLLGFAGPVVLLIINAFNASSAVFNDQFVKLAGNSLSVSVLAAVIATFIALLIAYAQRAAPRSVTSQISSVATLGYAVPGMVLAVGLHAAVSSVDRSLAMFFRDQFGWSTGLIFTGTAAMLIYAYVVRFLSVSYSAISSGHANIPVSFDSAARSLGASPWKVVTAIHVPLLRRPVLVALMLVFVDAMRELPATLVLRPFNFDTLATAVHRLASDERLSEASVAALALVAIGVAPVILLNKLSDQ